MAEKQTDIPLVGIESHTTESRSLLGSKGFVDFTQEDDVETEMGLTRVIVQGNRKKPAILTYHDIGLNSQTCFQGFFNYPDMQPILKHFCVYHMNGPGQQEGALPLPQGSGLRHSESETLLSNIGKEKEKTGPAAIAKSLGKRASLAFTGDASAMKSYVFPTMDQLAEMILAVMNFYNLKQIIGFGVGSGANILSRFALAHSDRVEALVLLNGVAGKAGWTEWGYQKLNTWHLKGGTMSTSVEDYLLWHWFGKKPAATGHDLVHCYIDHIKAINPQNLAYFIDSYIKRTDLGIVKEIDPQKKKTARMIKCPVLLVAGDYSAQLDETVAMNARLDPQETQFIKFHCGGMILEEMPEKMCESFRLFLQGMGYVPSMSQTQLVETKARKRASIANGSDKAPIYTAPQGAPGAGGAMKVSAAGQQTHPSNAVDIAMC